MPFSGRRILLSLATAALASSLCLNGAVLAHADPATVEQTRQQALAVTEAVARARADLERLDREASSLEEDYAQARLQVDSSQRRLDTLRSDIATQVKKIAALSEQAQDYARADFQNRGLDTTTKIFVSGDPDSFLREISTARKVDENINTVLQEYQAEQAAVDDLRRAAAGELAARATIERRVAALEAQAKQKVAEAAAVLDRLSAEQRLALEAQERAELEEQLAQAAAAALADQPDVTRSEGGGDEMTPASDAPPVADPGTKAPVSNEPADARALAAARYARAQVGDAYVWAAEGPSAFDCSGLTLSAYKSAGVSLPHSSRVQFGMGTPVSRDSLRPGDLLFWYTPVHHVGMYVGGGMFVHARNVRVGVVIQSVVSYGAPFSGARRIVG